MPERAERKSLLQDLVETIVFAFIVAMLIRTFVIEPFLINGPSMQPEFHTGERLYLNRAVYHLRQPRRFEVIVFRYPLNPSKDYLKRVIGLPGERLAIKGGVVYINGQPLTEDHPMVHQAYDFAEITIPPDSVFVMGDNRPNSEDSRSFGPVPLKNIKGKAFIRFWPLNAFGLVK